MGVAIFTMNGQAPRLSVRIGHQRFGTRSPQTLNTVTQPRSGLREAAQSPTCAASPSSANASFLTPNSHVFSFRLSTRRAHELWFGDIINHGITTITPPEVPAPSRFPTWSMNAGSGGSDCREEPPLLQVHVILMKSQTVALTGWQW